MLMAISRRSLAIKWSYLTHANTIFITADCYISLHTSKIQKSIHLCSGKIDNINIMQVFLFLFHSLTLSFFLSLSLSHFLCFFLLCYFLYLSLSIALSFFISFSFSFMLTFLLFLYLSLSYSLHISPLVTPAYKIFMLKVYIIKKIHIASLPTEIHFVDLPTGD